MKMFKKALSAVLSAAIMLSCIAVFADDAENVVLSTTEATTLYGRDAVLTGGVVILANNNKEQYPAVSSKTETGTIEFTFDTEVSQNFSLSFIGMADFQQNGGLSLMDIQIDDNAPVLLSLNTNVTLPNVVVETGENVYGIGMQSIPYSPTVALSAGTHTIRFIVDDLSTSTNGYYGGVASITLTPAAIPEVNTTEETTLYSTDAVLSGATKYTNNSQGTPYASINTSTGSGAIEFVFTAEEKQVYNLSFIGMANFQQNGGLSLMDIQIDDGNAEELSINTNVTLGANVTTGENVYGITMKNITYNKRLAFDAGTHSIKFIIDDLSSQNRYSGGVASLTLKPVEISTISTAEETTLNAADFAIYGTNVKSSGTGDAKYAKASSISQEAEYVIPFRLEENGKFKISIDSNAKITNGTGTTYDHLPAISVKIDDGSSVTLWDHNTTVAGDGAHEFHMKSRILEYSKIHQLEAGKHTLTIVGEKAAAGYLTSIGNITFIPQSVDVTVNAVDFVSTATGYVPHSTNANVVITYNTPGTITVELDILRDSYYNLIMDLYAKMSSSDTRPSPLYMQLDNQDPVLLSSANTTLTAEQVAEYPGIGMLNEYRYNTPLWLEEGQHTVTFSVTEISEEFASNGLYLTAIDDVSFAEVKGIESIEIIGAIENMNIGANQALFLYDADGNEITPDTVAAITYESSDNSVLTVDGTGMVKAVGNGSATVTVKARQFANSENELSATVTLYAFDSNICIYNKQSTVTGAAAVLKAKSNLTGLNVIMAKYTSSGALAGVETVYSGDAAKNEEIPLNASFGTPAEGETVKVMVWSSLDGMVPVCDAVEF